MHDQITIRGQSMKLAWTSALLGLCLLSGCTVGPNHAEPVTLAPGAWPESPAGTLAEAEPDLRTWWARFEDPTLNDLVGRALEGNLDLREAAARVREARALRGVAASDQFPTINVGASASYSRDSENAFGNGGGGSGGGGSNSAGQENDLYDAGFDAAWEIDVFGRVRRSVEAADADLAASLESERDVRVILVAEVARTYMELRASQSRLEIANQNVSTQKETLELSQDRLGAGLGTELQVSQATTQLESTRSQIPVLMAQVRRAAHRLDVLLGQQPGTLRDELGSAQVPPSPELVQIGLPAELLRRRPDIRRAERELAAATARVGVATADLYPRLTLNGSFGVQSEDTGNLFDASSRTWSVGPLAVRWPIFTAGRVRSAIRVNEARQEQALIAYERTVLLAYEEVANALVSYARVRERRESLTRAMLASATAVELSQDLWTRGLTDFLNVLDSQRALFLLQDQLAESAAEEATSLVAIYKALGGGWDDQAVAAASSR
ncbi:MAG: efflux transporter outer membrane subunit [Phycisphaeraceae bacterium]|nr:MAG: efflux transporter outer membrane subunit [Phycisphaeraceae bacterium]